MSFGFGMVVGHGTWWGTGGCGPTHGGGKSAVQLLQESKSRYVKSGRVLGSRQAPSRPDRLHISANPNIFLSAPAHTLHPHSHHGLPPHTLIGAPTQGPPPVPPRSTNVTSLTAVALAQYSGPSTCGISLPPPPLPARLPRGSLRPRAKTQPVGDALPRGGDLRRSLSHGPGDRGGDDVQMKLRRLLNTDSRESLAVQVTPDDDAHTPAKAEASSGTFRAEVVSVSSHKSLPDLIESIVDKSQRIAESHRRPSCPGALTLDSIPAPPPRPPRKSFGECPPRVPTRPPPPRPPPPKRSVANGVLRNGVPSESSIKNFSRKASASSSSTDEGSTPFAGSSGAGNRRRPILRSKSDVTHERPLGSRWEDNAESRRSSYCSAELETFFDSMGLDGSTLRLVESPLPCGADSPPVYFEEHSSEESSGLVVRRESEEDSDELKSPQVAQHSKVVGVGAPPISRRLTGEPSIVEKNARVIKWLFNCQRARSGSIPRSLSSGS